MFGKVERLSSVSNKTHRFVILVCAKNEEKVIDQLIGSIKNQNYPAAYYDIFITADNCTDRTAAVARAAGARVFERFDLTRKSKGFALNWFFEKFLKEYNSCYDACIVFDADNIANREFLAAMNHQLNAGHKIATGYRLGKNPSSTWVSGCSSLFWLLQTRCFFIPRTKLGIPCCTVGGTGFMFDLSVLGEHGWHTSSVCEDIEFSLNSIADGHFIAFAPDAVFYDEQPLTFGQSLKQRYRWALGSLQSMSICTPKLMDAFRKHKPGVADALLYSLGTFITGISGLFGTLLVLLDTIAAKSWSRLPVILGIDALGVYMLMVFLAWLVLFLEKKSWPGSLKTLLTFPFYMAPWSVINLIVLFYRDPIWHDIPHTDSISIDEIEK
jgi:cellulose synthase/poly-beta-1,6-N-acetylglucosamine synthase-like glycosyltransferase